MFINRKNFKESKLNLTNYIIKISGEIYQIKYMRHSYNLFVAKLTFFFNFIKSYIKYLFFSDWGPSGPSRAIKGGQRPSRAVGGRWGPLGAVGAIGGPSGADGPRGTFHQPVLYFFKI